MRCYNCEAEVNWLADDSRCGDCTRLTEGEIVGVADESEAYDPDYDYGEDDFVIGDLP